MRWKGRPPIVPLAASPSAGSCWSPILLVRVAVGLDAARGKEAALAGGEGSERGPGLGAGGEGMDTTAGPIRTSETALCQKTFFLNKLSTSFVYTFNVVETLVQHF